MLFRKSLRLSAAARADHGAGGIANLQANDCTKLYGLVQYLHVLWSGPFQVRQASRVALSLFGTRHCLAVLMHMADLHCEAACVL